MISNPLTMHPGEVLAHVYMAEMWGRMQAEDDLWEARKKAA